MKTWIPAPDRVEGYCSGCCPYEHCPNGRSAEAVLNEMNYRVLDMPSNIDVDWVK